MSISPYLMFEGRAAEAIAFYEQAVGAHTTIKLRFRDAPPGMGTDPAKADKIMHATLRIGGAELSLSDAECSGKTAFGGFSITLGTDDEAEAARWFKGLASGGSVRMVMSPTFFAKSFGMVTDRFGVGWMVMVPQS